MNIYKLSGDVSSFRKIAYSNTCIENMLLFNRPIDKNSCSGIILKWSPNSSTCPIGDSPFITGSLPVFSNTITEQLVSAGLVSGINLIPVNVEGQLYNLFVACNRLSNILNKNKSKIEYFPDGRIMYIKRYSFQPQNIYPDWFVVDEYPRYTFVSDRVKQALDKIKPSGLIIEKCLCSI